MTIADLNAAIAGTARNPSSVSTLDNAYADPEKEEMRAKINELINETRRV